MRFFKIFTPIVIAIFLIIFDYKFAYLNNLRQSVATLISPIYMVVSLPKKLYTWINEQGSSKEQLLNNNRSLTNELLKLKVKLQQTDALALENKKLNALLESSYTLQQANFTIARTESISRSRLKKQIIINKGSNNNLKIGQVALGANGVLGQITQTTPTTASILIASDPTQYIPIKSVRNGIQGISQGLAENKHQLLVQFIEPESDIKIGDIFVTNSLGSKFPNGYPVGRVVQAEQRKNESFMHITLEPMQQIHDLEFVIILDDL